VSSSARARRSNGFVLLTTVWALAAAPAVQAQSSGAATASVTSVGAAQTGAPALRGGPGHHTFEMLRDGNPLHVDFSAADSGVAGLRGVQLPEPPLATGPYINFESPLIQALALTADGQTLLAVNPANGTLVALDVADQLARVAEIPVGISPCSVAIQPGTGDNIAWVANHISDNVSIVDLAAGRVIAVIEVGDEPATILFDEVGQFAFVVLQGSPIASEGEPVVQDGALVAIDTVTRQIVSALWLDVNSPRTAVINHGLGHVVVAGLFTGNNTTVVGHPVAIRFAPPNDPPGSSCDPNCLNDCFFFPLLGVVQAFSQTSGLFGHPLLSPWPDLHEDPQFPAGPFVERIVADAGHPADADHPWQQIVELLSDGNGQPDPGMVAALNAEFGLVNADEIIAAIINDAKDSVDHDLAVVDVSDPAGAGLSLVRHVENVGTVLTGMALNQIGEIFVANTEAQNLTRLEANLRGRLVDHRVTIVLNPHLPEALVHPQDLNAGIPGFTDVGAPNPLAQQLALAQPQAIAFDAGGSRAYGVASGSGRLFVLDGLTANVLGRVDVGTLPTSVAVDSAEQRVFVMDRLDYTVYQVDVADDEDMQVQLRRTLFNPEPAEIPLGRPFLYSTRFSNNFSSACATCHTEAHLDGMAWDLGDPAGTMQPATPPLLAGNHPLKGPMVTQSLRGLQDHEPFHWRGDRPVFQDFNPAFVGLLGGEEQLLSEDMDAFTDFIKTVRYPPAPYRNRDNSFKDPGGLNGGLLFGITESQSCNACHLASHAGALPGPGQDQGFSYVGGIFFAQTQLVPQSRGGNKKFRNEKYCGFGLLHDGREESEDNGHPLQTFLQQFFCNFNAQQRLDLIAFMEAFPTEVDPVVGWQVLATATVDQPIAASVLSDVNLMIARHAEAESACDVVAKGVVGGVPHGYTLIATEPGPVFQSDIDTALSLSGLIASLGSGDSLIFTAVPPGSGKRLGIDQDTDGMGDGLDPTPQHDDDGDVNLDGLIAGTDIQDFIMVTLNSGQAPFAKFHAADVDNDLDVDSDDLDEFLFLLLLPL